MSNALAGTGRVSAETAARIKALVEEVGYVPRHAARALRTGRSGLLGLVAPDLTNPTFPSFTQAISRAARQRGFAVLLADSRDDNAVQTTEIAHLLSRGADALIIIPRRGSVIEKPPVPTAIIDSAGRPDNVVSSDHREGGRAIARHLRELGHRRILILAGPKEATVARERTSGMADVLAGVKGAQWRLVHSEPSLAAGERLAPSERADATAIACAYDSLAIGAIAGLLRAGVCIPEDVSVTGFDDLAWGAVMSPALTSVRQDFSAIAEIAVAHVLGEPSEPQLVPMQLIVRASSAPPSTQAFRLKQGVQS
ncbi:LacI family DNA-binding transcriptional regulator [Terrarubrum flagellatum]|uniref:LacI family DNA-binding transcriptional regulator n=1 Tax=Terrirubrum flagellatum TaxID=2895980 RepID=UPI003145419A